MIQVEHISKSFGSFPVLRDISLTADKGDVLVICGASGSGKSTFVKTLNGLESIDEGIIRIGDFSMTANSAPPGRLARTVGMVFQHFELFPHLSVLRNVMLAQVKVLNRTRKAARWRAHDLLTQVGLSEHTSKFPGQLSGGQQQRVAIARALALDPEIMLFDEATSSLDPELVNEVLEVMVQLAKEGMTMVCVTHELAFARRIADRVIFMDQGQIVESGPASKFFDCPRTDRARRFLSSITHR